MKKQCPKVERVAFDHILKRVKPLAKKLGLYVLSTMGRQAHWTIYDASTGSILADYYPETFILASSDKRRRMKAGSAFEAIRAVDDWKERR
jgi:hypothetical protein